MQEEKGVVINGVRWATRNVGAPGTFVENPEDFGEYYTWEEAKNACPKGWRLPTEEEVDSLCEMKSVWQTLNGVNGRSVFASQQIFLPAAGLRSYNCGEIVGVGNSGFYRSITETNYGVVVLSLDTDKCWNETPNDYKNGYPVRCVAEDSQPKRVLPYIDTQQLLKELFRRENAIVELLYSCDFSDSSLLKNWEKIGFIRNLLDLNYLSTYEDICEELKKLMRI